MEWSPPAIVQDSSSPVAVESARRLLCDGREGGVLEESAGGLPKGSFWSYAANVGLHGIGRFRIEQASPTIFFHAEHRGGTSLSSSSGA